MRVAIIHHQLKLKGGMETYLLNLIKGFNQQKDNVTVFVYKKYEIEDSSLCKVHRKNLSWLPRKFRKYWFGSKIYKQERLSNFNLSISLMRSFHQDIIICGGTHLGFLSCTRKKPSLLDKLEIACERKSYRTSTKIIAHSALLKDELINLYGISPDKIVMSYPPVDTAKFNQLQRLDKEALRARYNIHPEKKALLFPSTGHERKGLSILIEAIKQLSADKYELIVAGKQPRNINVSNVKYVGFVENMISLYTACDLTILPSFYEPFGLVVVESLECGTPVIISPYVGAKDLVTPNEGIVLKDLSPSTIAAAIEQATQHEYEIAKNFVGRMQLTVDEHIKKLKQNIPHTFRA